MLLSKASAVALLTLNSSVLLAGSMGSMCSSRSVSMPCEQNAWSFGGQALYLQTAHTGPFGYLGTVNGRFNALDSGWDWGFALDGRYQYDTNKSVGISWNHVDYNSNHFVSITDSRRYQTNWDAVNIEFSQSIELSEVNNVRIYSGAQYARINSSVNKGMELTGYNSDFNGFGPRVGVDLRYGLGNGFSVYSNTAGGLLVGTSSFTDLVTVDVHSGSNTIVSPEVEARLGAGYTCAVNEGRLTIDAGYMWIDYINAHYNTATSGTVVQEGSFASSGPYFGLNYMGSA